MINGSIAIHCSASSLAPKAFDSLRFALGIFSRLHELSSRAKAAHAILGKIHDSAIAIFNRPQGRGQGSKETSHSRLALTDDLEMWAGYTKVRLNKSDGKLPKADQTHGLPASSVFSQPQSVTGHDGGDGTPNYGLYSQAPSREVAVTHIGDPHASSAFAMSDRDTGDKRLTRQSGQYATQDLPATPAHPGYAYQEPYQLRHPSTDGLHTIQWEGSPQMVPPITTYAISDEQWLAYMQTGESSGLNTNINLNAHTPYQSL